MSKRAYTYNHSLILFLKILCTFNYSDGILRLWDKHKTRATVNKIMQILKFNYDEYNSLMKTLEMICLFHQNNLSLSYNNHLIKHMN